MANSRRSSYFPRASRFNSTLFELLAELVAWYVFANAFLIFISTSCVRSYGINVCRMAAHLIVVRIQGSVCLSLWLEYMLYSFCLEYRIAQFIKLFPAITDTNRSQSRAEAIKTQIQQECPQFEQTQLTELGRKLFGLAPWPDTKTD